MRIVVTGGGTGGHVYPALEVAKLAQEEGDLVYMGSLRGIEGAACEKLGIHFKGFESEPIYSIASFGGLKAMAKMLLSSAHAQKAMKAMRPDVVFSTGGYSSAPIMRAAGKLGIPMALHICDSVPGRALKMFADKAKVVTSTFNATQTHLDRPLLRTGHPIRQELRSSLGRRQPDSNLVVVMGGSGGAKFLNEMVPKAARLMPNLRVVHSTGKGQYEQFKSINLEIEDRYEVVPYLEPDRLTELLQTATLAISRSGAGISEYAMARMPSILVPLPTSMDDHQLFNAKEFESMGAAQVCIQSETTPESLASAIRGWLEDEKRRDEAALALSKWDVPDATYRIWSAVKGVGQTGHAKT